MSKLFESSAPPTKTSLADYEKKLTSNEQSVKKVLTQLEKSIDVLEAAKEQELAHKKSRCVQYSAFVFSINCCPAAGLVVLLVVAGEWFTLITPNTCLLCLFFSIYT